MSVRMKRVWWWVLLCLAAALPAGYALMSLPKLWAHGEASAEKEGAPPAAAAAGTRQQSAVTVTADRARRRPIQRTVQVVGEFAGYDEVTVMAEVSGRVTEVLHDLGDIVRPGDVLLKIDSTDYELAVRETRRALELEATRLGIPIPDEAQFKPAILLPQVESFDPMKLPMVVRAQEERDNAFKKRERAEQLLKQNSTSVEAFERDETDYQVSENALIQAKLDARAVVAGIKHRLVLLEMAEKKLERTEVKVPVPTRRAGMPKEVEYSVAKRKVAEGEMVKDAPGSSTEVFDLVLDKVLKFRAAVPERYVGEVKAGQQVALEVEAYPGKKFGEGRIVRVSPAVDRNTRTFEVEAEVPNPGRELRPGGFAKADILTRIAPDAIAAPLAAVYAFVGSTRVFVVRDGKAHVVPVTLGAELPRTGLEKSGWVELVDPDPGEIRPGIEVITTAHSRLSEGTPVIVRRVESKQP